MKSSVFFLLLLLSSSGSRVAASEKPLIEWFVTATPPMTIMDGQFKGQGYGDVIYQSLREKLTDHRHSWSVAKMGYSQGGIMHHDNVCAYDLLKTPKRAKYMVFSKPIYHILPLGLITLEQTDVSKLLDDRGYFVMPRLVQHKEFTLGVVLSRSYGVMLDKQLQKLPKGKNVLVLSNDNTATELFKLMTMQRIDASLGFIMEAHYLFKAQVKQGQRHQIAYYPVANQPRLLIGRISCNRSEFGQQVIAAVNQRIDAADLSAISRAYQRWLPDNTKVLYQQLIAP